MQVPLQVTFKDVDHSDALEANIREKAAKLEQYYPNIISCRVSVESVNHRHHKGNLYNIHIDVAVPNGEIVVSHAQNDKHAHEDPYVAVRDSFAAAKRQLQDHLAKQRGEIKQHHTAQ